MSTSLCLLLLGLSPSCQMTARKPEPGTSTGSGWDLAWLMSVCPITQSCSACLVPHPTPSLTGPVTSVSSQTGPPVTSVDPMTCRSSSSPTQPTLLLEVCRYCTITLYWHFLNQRLVHPPGCWSLLMLFFLPLITFTLSDCLSVQPSATEGSSVKVTARGCVCKMLQLGQQQFRVQRCLSAVIFTKSGKIKMVFLFCSHHIAFRNPLMIGRWRSQNVWYCETSLSASCL